MRCPRQEDIELIMLECSFNTVSVTSLFPEYLVITILILNDNDLSQTWPYFFISTGSCLESCNIGPSEYHNEHGMAK